LALKWHEWKKSTDSVVHMNYKQCIGHFTIAVLLLTGTACSMSTYFLIGNTPESPGRKEKLPNQQVETIHKPEWL
jgi:hypothetical protein